MAAQTLLVATDREVLVVRLPNGSVEEARGLEGTHPTSLAADPNVPGRAFCVAARRGIFRSQDDGASWTPSGLHGKRLMTVAVSPAQSDLVWAGTEPSELWRSTDAGAEWEAAEGLMQLPSSSYWAFPPRPETHHVRWILCHPTDPGRIWLAIEAGALVTSRDGGRSWRDRVPGGPYDTHEAAIHSAAPDTLRASAGDGYFESRDGGATWSSPMDGLEVGYLRSLAIDPGDPETVVVSAASGPYSAYATGRSDGHLYRRQGTNSWRRVLRGWPEPAETIAPLLTSGFAPGELWAADERGVHTSSDGGSSWDLVAPFRDRPSYLRGLALLR